MKTAVVENIKRLALVVVLAVVWVFPLGATAGEFTDWEAQAPQNCSPINPAWTSSIWNSPNGLKNIGKSPIWVVCALTRTWDDLIINVWVDLINQADVAQTVICGLREYEYDGGTLQALPQEGVLAAGEASGGAWIQQTLLDGLSGLSLACKLEPKMVLKLVSWTPNPDPV